MKARKLCEEKGMKRKKNNEKQRKKCYGKKYEYQRKKVYVKEKEMS